VYTSSSAPSPYSNFLSSINSKKHIDNNYFKIPLPTSCFLFLYQVRHAQKVVWLKSAFSWNINTK
jgi:hypothetical protein